MLLWGGWNLKIDDFAIDFEKPIGEMRIVEKIVPGIGEIIEEIIHIKVKGFDE